MKTRNGTPGAERKTQSDRVGEIKSAEGVPTLNPSVVLKRDSAIRCGQRDGGRANDDVSSRPKDQMGPLSAPSAVRIRKNTPPNPATFTPTSAGKGTGRIAVRTRGTTNQLANKSARKDAKASRGMGMGPATPDANPPRAAAITIDPQTAALAKTASLALALSRVRPTRTPISVA